MSDPLLPMHSNPSSWLTTSWSSSRIGEGVDALATTQSFAKVGIPAQAVPLPHEAFRRFCQTVIKSWSVLHPGGPFGEAQLTTLEELQVLTRYQHILQPLLTVWNEGMPGSGGRTGLTNARQRLTGLAQASLSPMPAQRVVPHSPASVLMLLVAAWAPGANALAALCGPASEHEQTLRHMHTLDQAIESWSGMANPLPSVDAPHALVNALIKLSNRLFVGVPREPVPIALAAKQWQARSEEARNCALQVRLTRQTREAPWVLSLAPCGWGVHHALTVQPTWQEGVGARIGLRIVDKGMFLLQAREGWSVELGIANALPEMMPAPVSLASLRRLPPGR